MVGAGRHNDGRLLKNGADEKRNKSKEPSDNTHSNISMKRLLFLLFVLCACRTPAYLKFDDDPPGLTPKVFAKNLIAADNEYVGYCAFSPDGSELYYSVTTRDWFPSHIVRVSTNNLQKKDTLLLQDRNYESEPFMTRDGKTMFFTAVLPPGKGENWNADIYKVRRTESGWSQAERLNSVINTKAGEWHISLSNANTVYFTSEREEGTSALHGDIYKAEIAGDYFVNLTKLPEPVNTKYNDSDPLIAPDESYLIFHSDRPGGYGNHDLYICFNNKGSWTVPVNMGAAINSAGWEMAPSLTPDGKYLLYTYRKEMTTNEPSKIYWVDMKILKNYRED